MATILDRLTPEAQLGQMAGRGLSSGLQSLIQSKLGQLQTQSGLSSLVGPKQAETLSYLPPEILKMVLPGIQKQQQFQQGLSYLTGDQQQGLSSLMGDQQQGETTPQVTTAEQSLAGSTKDQRIAKEEQLAKQAEIEKYHFTGGDRRAAIKAGEDVRKRLQRERIAEDKKESERTRLVEKRITSGLESSRKKAETLSENIESKRESINNYKNIKDYIDTGKVDLGLIFQAKNYLNIDTTFASPETQAVAKALAAEPIRSLRGLPGQAARLSKVFDQLKAINGTLKNTPEGLKLIADTKIIEAKASNIIDKAELNARESYRRKGQDIPLNLREKIVRSPEIKKKLAKFDNIVLKRVSNAVTQREPDAKLSNFPEGKIINIDGTGEYYEKTKLKSGDFIWKNVPKPS